MDQRTFDRKVTELAEKLKASGVATSDSMAKQLAADIIRTEQSVRNDDVSDTQEDEQPSSGPKNLVVEEAIRNAQGAAHSARLDDDVDQEKSIAELLEEDTSQHQQAKVTLDTPVVEGGVAKQEVTDDAFLQSKPQPEPVSTSQESEVESHQGTVEPSQQEDSSQESVQEPQQAESSEEPQPQQETPKEEFKPEEKVDLSEMFNFSKKK